MTRNDYLLALIDIMLDESVNLSEPEPDARTHTYFDLPIRHHGPGGFDYVDASRMPEEYLAHFWRWMTGQTSPMIEGCTGCVYLHDFDRWYELVTYNKPTYFD